MSSIQSTITSHFGGWNRSWPRSIRHRQNTLPASDAPVATLPGQRRDNVFSPKPYDRAALPQPDSPRTLLSTELVFYNFSASASCSSR